VGQRQSDFEALVVPHAAGLLRFARRLSGRDGEAEDIVQDALLRAWRGIDGLRVDSNPRAWLFRILLNTWYSAGRKKNARPVEIPIREAGNARSGVLATGSLAESTELNEALARLPDDQRTVLLLAVVEGFTCKELALMLGIPIGTVMSRLSRARAAMRELVPRQEQARPRQATKERLEQV
jgi:RNA polymerase sigma-70 factor (ECF subfamily)